MDLEREALTRVASRLGIQVPAEWTARRIAEEIAAKDSGRRAPRELLAEWREKVKGQRVKSQRVEG